MRKDLLRIDASLKSNGLPWTPQDDTLLASCARMGLSRKEAASRLFRTYETTRVRASVLGVQFQRDVFGGYFRTPYEVFPAERRKDQEKRDRAFIRALAVAMYRGDHLPGASNVG